MNAPQEQAPRFHPCFGGYAACSGVNPCKTCQRVKRERVDSRAVVAAGLNGMMLAAVHVLANQVRQAGLQPEQILGAAGVDPNILNAPPERQVQAFWNAQDAALAELHREMDGGELAGQFMVTDTASMPPQVIMNINRRYGQPAAPPPPPPMAQHHPSYVQPMPPAGFVPMTVPDVPPVPAQSFTSYAGPYTGPVGGMAPSPPQPASSDAGAVSVAGVDPSPPPAPVRVPIARVRPLSAEDIAASAIPAAPPSKDANGRVEGS